MKDYLLVRLICHTGLPHYCAVHLKEMSFHFTVFIYKYITFFHECILQQYKEQCISFYIFILDLVLHVFTFICSPINVFFFTHFRFYKIVHMFFLE